VSRLFIMCYNCGCKKPNDNHGKTENIINETIRKSAEAMGVPFKDAINNIGKLIEIERREHANGKVHDHTIDHDHDHDHS